MAPTTPETEPFSINTGTRHLREAYQAREVTAVTADTVEAARIAYHQSRRS